MKLFAYPTGAQLNEYGLVELKEVSLSADTDTIRAIAKFLSDAADEMEKLGGDYDHVHMHMHMHMQDRSPAWRESWPDIVVCKTYEETT